MKIQKGSTLIGILAIIIVAFILGAGFLGYKYYLEKEEEAIEKGSETIIPEKQEQSEQTQTPEDETADWKTYRNEEYGFEIRYSGDWNLDLREAPLFSF